MGAGLGLVVFAADLAFELLGGRVDGGVEIGIAILGVEVIATDPDADPALELLFGGVGRVILFEGDPGIQEPAVDVIEFFEPLEYVLLDGLGQRDVVGRQDKLHG